MKHTGNPVDRCGRTESIRRGQDTFHGCPQSWQSPPNMLCRHLVLVQHLLAQHTAPYCAPTACRRHEPSARMAEHVLRPEPLLSILERTLAMTIQARDEHTHEGTLHAFRNAALHGLNDRSAPHMHRTCKFIISVPAAHTSTASGTPPSAQRHTHDQQC